MTLLALGSVLAAAAIGQELAPEPWITMALGAIGLYFFGFGIISPTLQSRRE
jgi:hypothetical protein